MPDRISENQGKLLIAMAKKAIAGELGILPPARQMDGALDRGFLMEKRGLFVTLHKQGGLRGCIGIIEPVSELGKTVEEYARAAAFQDSRFSPLQPEEFEQIDVEISLLSPPVALDYENAADLTRSLVPHRDGVVLKKGFRKATFLPQVWEQLPSPEQFLSHLCMKAGLPPDAWETGHPDIFIYEVQAFGELES